jgi:aryl-alcohol dehydrogenase-like predicted oxidoreductase
METRPFGNTGYAFPILGFGCGGIGNELRCSEEEAIRTFNLALDRGIRYFDTAWTYSDGRSEARLGKVTRHRRDEMWIATKVWDTTRDGARRQLEESLKRLQTDHIDEWRLHDMGSYARLDAFTAKGGGLEAAIRAKEEGLVGHISISGHANPQILVEAFNRFPFESALVPLSVLDHFMLSFAAEFLPTAQARGIPVVAMKTLGFGSLAHDARRALRYAFSQPVALAIVGMESVAQLEQNLEIAESFVPMSDEERLAFYRDILPLVRPEKMVWKADNWSAPTGWVKREAPSCS